MTVILIKTDKLVALGAHFTPFPLSVLVVCKTWNPPGTPPPPPESPGTPIKIYYFNILPTLFFHLYDERISKNELGSGNKLS